jgi:hypothetical protein
MMKWYPLSPGQFLIFLILVAIADVFTVSQKFFVPEIFRPFTYLAFVIVMLIFFFFVVRPTDPMLLARTITVILGVITVILLVVQDVLLAYNLSWKTVIVLAGAFLGPVIAGYLYVAVRRPQTQ